MRYTSMTIRLQPKWDTTFRSLPESTDRKADIRQCVITSNVKAHDSSSRATRGGTNRLIISKLGGVQSTKHRSQPTDTRIGELQSMERASRIGCFAQKKKEPEHFYLEHYTRGQRLLQTATPRANTPLAATNVGGKIRCFTDDYANVPIEEDSIIYCDIPYEGTNVYQKDGFDFERFYDWCFRQTEPVFISSYQMPSDFECVATFKHTQSLCATKTSTVYEKLFVPKSQKTRLYYQQLSLFD